MPAYFCKDTVSSRDAGCVCVVIVFFVILVRVDGDTVADTADQPTVFDVKTQGAFIVPAIGVKISFLSHFINLSALVPPGRACDAIVS